MQFDVGRLGAYAVVKNDIAQFNGTLTKKQQGPIT
jgi:hypothetical protein